MPRIGDIIWGRKLGYKTNHNYMWATCPICGKERWIRSNAPNNLYCHYCSIKRKARTYSENCRLSGYKTALASKVGFHPLKDHIVYWGSCPSCGKQSWRQKSQLNNYCLICKSSIIQSQRLKGKNNPRWCGGRIKNGQYIAVLLEHDNLFIKMAKKNRYVLEHRYIMAQHLGRCLEKWEIVHHINRIKTDNQLQNLKLVSSASNHSFLFTKLESRMSQIENRITLLEAEKELLRVQLLERV